MQEHLKSKIRRNMCRIGEALDGDFAFYHRDQFARKCAWGLFGRTLTRRDRDPAKQADAGSWRANNLSKGRFAVLGLATHLCLPLLVVGCA